MPGTEVYKTDDIKLTDLVRSFKVYSIHLLKRSWVVVIWTFIFTMAGYYFAVLSPVNYLGYAAFNAVDAKTSGSLGGLMSFASSLGIGAVGGSSNDVLMGLYTSRNVIKSAFLSEGEYEGKQDKLINIYMDIEEMTEDIQQVPGFEKFRFTSDDIYSMSKREDSILSFIYVSFVDNNIEVEFDPMAGLIKGGVISPSFDFSQQMCSRMLEFTDLYYSQKQDVRNDKSMDVVLAKLDSVTGALRAKEAQLSRFQNYAKYNLRSENSVEITNIQRDMSALTFMYNDALQAREAAKSSMKNVSSAISVIDHPRFATEVDKRDKVFWMIIGAAVGLVLSIIVVLVNKAIDTSFEEEEAEKVLLGEHAA